ncbi:MAG: hypothetical protein J6T74_08025 [Clostridia bacterium]|nr:hypothetical protein [Clostridia bacterium]
MKLNFKTLNKLMISKYKATTISKQQFKDMLYGLNRTDLSDNISELTEGIIKTENTVFYMINDVKVLNDNCKCLNPKMFPNGKVLAAPLSMFYPYILFVVEKSEDGKNVINYAKWGSFADNIFDELAELNNQ